MASGTSIGRMFVELGLKDTDFGGGMKNAENAVQGLQATGSKMAGMLNSAVTAGFKAAAAAAVGFATASVMVGQEFQQSLVKVGAIAGATGDEMQALEDKARELGASTEYTASQAAVAMGDFARAGMTVNEIVAASGPAMLLAGSAGADMAQATGLMAATLAQFNLEAGEGTRISDVYSTALRKSLFDMSSLTEAMKYAGTVGAAFGMTLEETTASVAMFRNLGLEGSMAGTNLRMAMAKAAKPTSKAAAILKQYGLTVRDINPELHSFGEIMQTVGDASITTTEMLEIFGTRAGANVAMIAKQFSDGSTDFHTLLDELENSAGSTAELYDAMGQTVQYQARVAMSALQELLISTFDTFKGPLQDLMAEIASTIQYVAQVFNDQAGNINTSFEDTIGAAVEYLRENKAEIAVAFVGFVKGASEAIRTLGEMLPLLISIGKGMVAIWVVNSVRTFTTAIVGVITQLWALRGSIHGVMASVTAATGGLYAIVAAIGAAIAVVAVWATSMREAEQAVQRLRDAEAQLEADRAARDARAAEAAADLADGMAVRLGLVMEQLQAEDQLTGSLERGLTALQNLDAEQIQAGIASGELFEATLNGQQVVLDHATALDLQWEATTLAADATDSLRMAHNRNREEQIAAEKDLAAVNAALEEYERQVALGSDSALVFGAVLAEYGDGMEDVTATVKSYEERLAELATKEKGLTEQRELSLQKLQAKETLGAKSIDNTGDAQRRAAQATREREQAEKDLANAMLATQKIVDSVYDDLAQTYMNDEQKAAASYEARLDALQAQFAEERALREEQGQEVLSLDAEQARAEAALWKLYQREQAEKRRQEELKAAQEVAEQVATLQAEAARAKANTLQAIELDRLAALEQAEGATGDQIAAINAVYDQRAVAARRDLANRVADLTSDDNEEVVRLTRERDALLAELDEGMVEERTAVMEHYGDAIEQVTSDAADDGEDNSGRLGVALTKAGDVALAAGKKVADGMKKLVSGIADLLGSITGFSFNLFDAVSAIDGDMQAAQDLADQLASGDISAQEYAEAMESLPASAAEGAENYITELINGALSMVQTFVNGAPVLIKQLAAQLPVLVQSVVDALPVVVQSLIAALPALIESLAASLVDLVSVVAEQLPLLVQALVEQIPTVIDALTKAIPVLVAGVDKAVVRVLEAVPGIVEKLLEQIPTLVTAVVASVDTIIVALVEAIPRLLMVVIEQLPTIVLSLVQGILSLVGTIISEILGELVPALLGMIPQLVTSLLESVVLLVQELVNQLPTLIEALLLAVTDIVVALLEMLPQLVMSIVEMLPTLITALVALIPTLITGVVQALPQIVFALISAIPALIKVLSFELPLALIAMIPQLVYALATEIPPMVEQLWEEVFKGIGDFAKKLWEAISGFFGDLFGGEGLVSNLGSMISGAAETVVDALTFWNDTPGMQQVGSKGRGTASFAPNDYVIAAQDPMELLRQALHGAGSLQGGSVAAPGMQGLSMAMLQLVEALGGAGAAGGVGGTGGNVRVTLEADGQVLDDVLYRAGTRGKAPHLERRARKATVQAGAQPGFNRGKYQK